MAGQLAVLPWAEEPEEEADPEAGQGRQWAEWQVADQSDPNQRILPEENPNLWFEKGRGSHQT